MELNSDDNLKSTAVEHLYEETLKSSWKMDGAMGAIAFAVLEMFRLGGLDEESILSIHRKMELYFMNPSNEECNAICKMVPSTVDECKVNERRRSCRDSTDPF